MVTAHKFIVSDTRSLLTSISISLRRVFCLSLIRNIDLHCMLSLKIFHRDMLCKCLVTTHFSAEGLCYERIQIEALTTLCGNLKENVVEEKAWHHT